ncbi:MAG: elongation factor G [Desulfobacteraceae bacterium]|nr:elongation factor G [Desulfobacteraceae bacterium]
MTDTADKLRNIVIIGHGGSGKTSMAEMMLYKTGITTRLGRVEEGNTVMDFEPEELKRRTSISSGFHQFPWKNHTISIIDTPGDQNFFTDTKMCVQAADGAVLVIDAIDGVKVQSELAWGFANDLNMPCIIFVNKMDRERSDFNRTMEDTVSSLEPRPVALQIPIGSEANFKGMVDLINMKAYTYADNGKAVEGEIPKDLLDDAQTQREALVETIVEADDALMERYLEGEVLTDEEIKAALKMGILARSIIPIICGSATKDIGLDLLLNLIADCMPSPTNRAPKKGINPKDESQIERSPDPNGPFSAFVFKTIADPFAGRLSIMRVVSGSLGSDGNFYNSKKEVRERFNQLLSIAGKEQKPAKGAGPGSIVAVAKLKETVTGDTLCDEDNKILYQCSEPMPPIMTFAVQPKSQGDEDKIVSSLAKLLEEDQALKIERNAETKQTLLSGMGQVHIEATIEKLKRKFNVDVLLTTPKVPYRETIKKKVRVQGRHKKQTGGHGQFGDCWVQFEPLPRGEGFEFVDAIVGGSIPKTYIPAVEKGIRDACIRGVLAGFPCVDFRATVDDGSYHAVDSSEMAFKIAGSLAFKKATELANPVLLEPVMKVTVTAPDEFMGDIMGDLNSRRGRVLGMDSAGKNQIINANVPMSEFLTYAPDLNSITGGRGMFTLEFSHFDEVPSQLTEKIIEAANKEKE